MILLKDVREMTENEWREFRRAGVGGSDIATLFKLNPYKSELALFLEKVGEIETPDLSENEAVYWGKTLESVVADEFKKRTGYEVNELPFVLAHEKYSFMLANIDREITDENGKKGVLECKTTSAYKLQDWTSDNIPFNYLLQVQHYLAVTGYDFGYIAVLIGGQHYKHFRIERDNEVIAMIEQRASYFWNENVLPKNPPTIDHYTKNDSELLNSLFAPKEDSTLVIEQGIVTEYLDKIKELDAIIKTHQDEKESLCAEIKGYMQEHERVKTPHASITWKQGKPSEYVKVEDLREKYPQIYDELKRERKATRRFMIRFNN